jgi:hypothetical protein
MPLLSLRVFVAFKKDETYLPTSIREVSGTNFGRGTDCPGFRPGYRLSRISAGVPTVPDFGQGTDCPGFRPGYRLFRISAGVPTVPGFGRGTDFPNAVLFTLRSPSRQIPGQYSSVSHCRFLPYPHQIIIFCDPTNQYYTVRATESVKTPQINKQTNIFSC